MALACGVDLVVELPYAFSTQSRNLANGAISILNALHVSEIFVSVKMDKSKIL